MWSTMVVCRRRLGDVYYESEETKKRWMRFYD